MSRLELVTECEHGKEWAHPVEVGQSRNAFGVFQKAHTGKCEVGSRIPLDPDRRFEVRAFEPGTPRFQVRVQDFLDALEDDDG